MIYVASTIAIGTVHALFLRSIDNPMLPKHQNDGMLLAGRKILPVVEATRGLSLVACRLEYLLLTPLPYKMGLVSCATVLQTAIVWIGISRQWNRMI